MSSQATYLDDTLYAYLQKNSLREAKILAELRDVTANLPMSQMQISPEQGQLMQLLIELMGAKKTLEIGVFTGYSTLAVALALADDGKIVACDVNEQWTNIAKEYWQKANVAHKIDLRIAPALETLDQLIAVGEDDFDFAFIDADKANYSNYFEKAYQLLRSGGLIIIDNVLWHGRVTDPNENANNTQEIRKMNEKLLHDERISISMLPVGDGITLARKK